MQSLYQGRPATLRNHATHVQLSILDDHEELELFNPLSYTETSNLPMSPAYSLSIFMEFCRLSLILDKILMSLYSEESASRDPNDLLNEANVLHMKLQDWRKDLPPHLDLLASNSVKTSLPHSLALL